MSSKIVWPDYQNCIANLPNSILKKWNLATVGDSLPLADAYLKKEYKNVVVLLLDGMGTSILENILDKNGPFRSHLVGSYKSVFLSTTVAATTSAMSGQQPCEHSWLGWECYYPQVDKNVVVFFNTVQGTDEPAADYNVPWTVTPYKNVVTTINEAGGKAYGCAPFLPPHPDSLEDICSQIKNLCAEDGQKYIYAYWRDPDGVLHRNGCKSNEAKEALISIEKTVQNLAEELSDTLILITADHGHIDTDYVVLQDYPELCDCLIRLPSLEPRTLNLFVKEDKKDFFEKEFNKLFGDKFLLMPMEEVISRQLFGTGTPHEHFRSMLGNYLAIAISDLTIFYTDERLVSMHGGLTEDEMIIPLIVFET